MTYEKLERVMWRLRRSKPNNTSVSILELRKAIIKECGYDERTYKRIKKALRDLGWIRAQGNRRIRLTGVDLNDS